MLYVIIQSSCMFFIRCYFFADKIYKLNLFLGKKFVKIIFLLILNYEMFKQNMTRLVLLLFLFTMI